MHSFGIELLRDGAKEALTQGDESMTDQAQWFDEYGLCLCGKPSRGIVRGLQNQSMGEFCASCAKKRIARAQKEREALSRRAVSET